jgi:hypothetical protein
MSTEFNIPHDVGTKTLFNIGVKALERDGWRVTPAGCRSPSLVLIEKDGAIKTAAITTTNRNQIGYNRRSDDSGWQTLSDAEVIVMVAVDKPKEATSANVHYFPADEVLSRFDRYWIANKAAHDYKEVPDHGFWLNLYKEESVEHITLIGAGLGLKYPPIANFALKDGDFVWIYENFVKIEPSLETTITVELPEAKKIIGDFYGVSESKIKINITV